MGGRMLCHLCIPRIYVRVGLGYQQVPVAVLLPLDILSHFNNNHLSFPNIFTLSDLRTTDEILMIETNSSNLVQLALVVRIIMSEYVDLIIGH